MKLVSVNCGLPREVLWHGRPVTTSFFKEPVKERVALRTLNLDGDRQSDLTVHGGQDKAVYCYPIEHYDFWRRELPGVNLPMGSFGENFTLEGRPSADGRSFEDAIHLGDRFAVGSAEVVVTQPRLPCYKLGIRFGSDAMVKRFLEAGRSGFYVAVVQEGEVGPGDAMTLVSRDAEAVPVSAVTRLYVAKRFTEQDEEQAQRMTRVTALPESWKHYFAEKLARLER